MNFGKPPSPSLFLCSPCRFSMYSSLSPLHVSTYQYSPIKKLRVTHQGSLFPSPPPKRKKEINQERRKEAQRREKRKSMQTKITTTLLTTSTVTDWLLDGGYVPNAVIRVGIRRQLAARLAEIGTSAAQAAACERKMRYIDSLRAKPIAVDTAAANSQHYEVAAGVLRGMLGPRMKYSSALYPKGGETLAQAEVAMLALYVERAHIRDGMSILDLG